MTDVLDDLGTTPPFTDDGDASLGDPPGDVHVCDFVGPDGVCGATFDAAQKLRAHQTGKHRDRSKDKRPGPAPKGKGGGDAKPSRSKAPRAAANAAAAAHTNRAATYSQSIAMAGLGCYLAIPRFDEYDLSVINSGAPNLAAALDALGEQNQTVRRTCDLILGGGSGGAALQLLLAAAAIAVPIAAHHGMVPAAAGASFGSLIGVAPTSPPSDEASASQATPPPDAASATGEWGDPSTWTPDTVLRFMSQVPESVMFDLTGRMMTGDGLVTAVRAPAPTAYEQKLMEGQDDERGPEQPNPEDLAAAAVP